MKLKHKWMRRLLTLVCVLAVCAIALISCDIGKTPDEVVPDNNIPNDSTTSEHEHTLVVDEAIAATCSKEGRTSGVHCSECQEVIVAQQPISKLAHTIVIDESVPATYEEEGLTAGAHCSVCKEVLVPQHAIPKLERPDDGGETPDNPGDGGETPDNPGDGGEIPDNPGVYPPGPLPECPEIHTKARLYELGIPYTLISTHVAEYCEDTTYSVYQCAGCGTYFADNIILPVAKCDIIITTEPTCVDTGKKTCTVCAYSWEIKATGKHVYNVSCGYEGERTDVECIVCGDVKKDVVVSQFHVWTITVVDEPECNNPGKALYTCDMCGHSKEVTVYADINSADHKWVYSEGQVGKCFPDGSTMPTITPGYHCADCYVAAPLGVIIIDGKEVNNSTYCSIYETKHNFIETINLFATCTTPGYKLQVCECGYETELETTKPLGHTWEREGATKLDFDTLTPDVTNCKASTDPTIASVIGKDVYTVRCGECKEGVTFTFNHTLTMNKVKAPTCTNEGYVYDYCEACEVEFNKRNVTPKVDGAHVYFTTVDEATNAGYPGLFTVLTPATCTKTGLAISYCKECKDVANENYVIPARGHDYYVYDANGEIAKDKDGNIIYSKHSYKYDCEFGYHVYTCTVCKAEDNEPNRVLKIAIEGWNKYDLTKHACWDAATGTWLGGVRVTTSGDCYTDRLVEYTCHGHVVVINYGKTHNIDPNTMMVAKSPTCYSDGHIGYEECLDCDYVKGLPGYKGILEALEHEFDPETYVEYIEPTCTENGSSGYGKCIREGCNCIFGIEDPAEREIDALGHNFGLVVDVNGDANQGADWKVTCTKYAYNHFICTLCKDESVEKWENYASATDHCFEYASGYDMPTCSKFGMLTCQNADCGVGYDEDGTPFATFKMVNKISHVDENGNPIICVVEDFFCFVCCDPRFENGVFTGEYGKDPLSAKESHQEFEVITIVGWGCNEYSYELHACDKCNETWFVGDVGYMDHDAEWVVKYFATPDTPGLEILVCYQCGEVLGEREYTYEERS